MAPPLNYVGIVYGLRALVLFVFSRLKKKLLYLGYTLLLMFVLFFSGKSFQKMTNYEVFEYILTARKEIVRCDCEYSEYK